MTGREHENRERIGTGEQQHRSGHGLIEIAGVQLEAQDLKKLATIMESQKSVTMPDTQGMDPKLML